MKNLFIPFPQFDVNYGAGGIPFFEEDSQQQEVEEYTFCWQEKVFSQSEIKKMKDSSSAMKKCYEKYHKNVLINKDQQNYPQKLFSYVEVDNYQQDNKNSSKISKKKISRSTINRDKNFKHGNIPKAKIVNYCPSYEFKGESDGSNDKYNQKMFIMIDLGPCNRYNLSFNFTFTIKILKYVAFHINEFFFGKIAKRRIMKFCVCYNIMQEINYWKLLHHFLYLTSLT